MRPDDCESHTAIATSAAQDALAEEAAADLRARRRNPLSGRSEPMGEATWWAIERSGGGRVVAAIVRSLRADGMSEARARKKAERMLALQRRYRRDRENAQPPVGGANDPFFTPAPPTPGHVARAWRTSPPMPELAGAWRKRLDEALSYHRRRQPRRFERETREATALVAVRRPLRRGPARRQARHATNRHGGARRATRASARGPDDGPGSGDPPPSGSRPHPDGSHRGLRLPGALRALVELLERVELAQVCAFLIALMRRPRLRAVAQ